MISELNIDPYLSHAIDMTENSDETTEEIIELVSSSDCDDLEKIISNDLERAFVGDDFDEFRQLLMTTFYQEKHCIKLYVAPWKTRSTLFDKKWKSNLSIFEEVLRSKRNKAAHISLTLKFYKLWNDEEFLNKKNSEGKTIMHHFADTQLIENLLSFLMFDWFRPNSHEDYSYSLVLKFQNFFLDNNESLLSYIYKIIDDENEKIYHDVCLRIIYQYLQEYSELEKETFTGAFLDIETFGAFSKLIELTNQEYVEEILQILLVFWITLENSAEYHGVKAKILNKLKSRSAETKKFFAMIFFLKERKSVRFMNELAEYVSTLKRSYGDYYRIILKPKSRLLYKITLRQNMLATGDFIFENCPAFGVSSTVLVNFYDVQDFKTFFVTPIENRELRRLHDLSANPNFFNEFLIDLEKYFNKNFTDKDQLEVTRFLFGRSTASESKANLFERILSTKGTQKLIEQIWDKIDLASREEVLNLKNPFGEVLLNFVVESEDDNNLVTFLQTTFYDETKFKKCKYFIMLQNNQYKEKKNESLCERYLSVCMIDVDDNSNLRRPFFQVIFALLEEVANVNDVRSYIPINAIFKLAIEKKLYRKFLRQNDMIIKDQRELKVIGMKRFLLDDIVAFVVAYWNISNGHYYTQYQETELEPLFELIFLIIKRDDKIFLKKFLGNLQMVEKFYKNRYGKKEEYFTSCFLFTMLQAAINNNQKAIVDCILNYESFVNITFDYPSNIRTSELCQHFAFKMLAYGYRISEIPVNWITSNLFKDFLDSRIKSIGINLVEIDCSFLVHPNLRKFRGNKNVDFNSLFNEDCKMLSYIIKHESLKKHITHPVLSTYINLKNLRQISLDFWNLGLFIAFPLLSFCLLIGYNLLSASHQTHQIYLCLKIYCALSILVMVTRETFQLLFISEKRRSYFKSKTNFVDIALILITSLTLGLACLGENLFLLSLMQTVTILFMTCELLTMLPSDSIQCNLMILKKVGTTFFEFFSLFILILSAFSISFYVMFGARYRVESIPSSIDEISQIHLENEGQEIFKSFDSIWHSLLKINVMLSGEYSIEPFQLENIYQAMIFAMFIFTTYIIFNLIVGLMVDDVETIRSGARYISLQRKAFKFIELCRNYQEIYKKFELSNYILHQKSDEILFDSFRPTKRKLSELDWFKGAFIKILIYFISRYPHLHNTDKVYVNIKTKDFEVKFDQKFQSAAKKEMDKEAFNSIITIVNEKYQHSYDNNI